MAAAGEAPNVARLDRDGHRVRVGRDGRASRRSRSPTTRRSSPGASPATTASCTTRGTTARTGEQVDHQLAGHVAVVDAAPHRRRRVAARRRSTARSPTRSPRRSTSRATSAPTTRRSTSSAAARCRRSPSRPTAPAHHRAVRAPVEGLLVVDGRRPHGRRAGRRHLERPLPRRRRTRARGSCGATSRSPTPRSTRAARTPRSPRRRCATPTRASARCSRRSSAPACSTTPRSCSSPTTACRRPTPTCAATGTSRSATPASRSATRATLPLPRRRATRLTALRPLVPTALPTPKVTAATTAPMSAMRSPARPAWRPVKIEVAAPTANSASTESDRGDDRRRGAAAEQERDHRERGAERERERTTRPPRPTATRACRGSSPSSSRASVSSATSLRFMMLSTSARAAVGRDALGPVDHLELLALLLRERAQLLLLDAQLVLVELALRADRDPLARRHRERAGDEPGDAGEQHDAVVGSCRRRRP